MNFLSKIKKGRGDEDDDDLDLEDEPSPEDIDEAENSSGGGLFRKLLGRLKEGTGDTEDIDGDEDDTTGPDEESSVQRVRLEGVADVRPVGPAAGAMMPPEDPVGSGAATEAVAPSDNQSVESISAAATAGAVIQASPGDSPPEPELDAEEDGGSAVRGINDSLLDIFEEAATVDENLKDLADSQEDIRAEDLAGELRELLSELER